MPCSASIWQASSAAAWSQALSISLLEPEAHPSSSLSTTPFQEAIQSVLRHDPTCDCGLGFFCPFAQYTILCAILETIVLSKRLVVNYFSVDAWRDADMSSFLSAATRRTDGRVGALQEPLVGKSGVSMEEQHSAVAVYVHCIG
jgi:hypothetical protein